MELTIEILANAIDQAGGVIEPGQLKSTLERAGYSHREINRIIQQAYESGLIQLDDEMRVKATEEAPAAA